MKLNEMTKAQFGEWINRMCNRCHLASLKLRRALETAKAGGDQARCRQLRKTARRLNLYRQELYDCCPMSW